MKFILELLSEKGTVSMTRLMSFIVCMTACYIAVNKGPDDINVITVLLSTAFAAKVIQKHIEVSNDRQ